MVGHVHAANDTDHNHDDDDHDDDDDDDDNDVAGAYDGGISLLALLSCPPGPGATNAAFPSGLPTQKP